MTNPAPPARRVATGHLPGRSRSAEAYSHVWNYFADTSPEAPRSPATDTPSNLKIFPSKLSIEERAVVHLVYASGCTRPETADVMKITYDYVDVLLRAVRASAG